MDIDRLEAVQRRMTNIIQEIRNLTYKNKLKHLNLHSLERCRVRGDLIEMFKWIKDFNNWKTNKVLIVKEKVRTRTDRFRYRKDIGKKWFTNRVADEWNKPSKHVVSAGTVYIFKTRLDISMDEENRW